MACKSRTLRPVSSAAYGRRVPNRVPQRPRFVGGVGGGGGRRRSGPQDICRSRARRAAPLLRALARRRRTPPAAARPRARQGLGTPHAARRDRLARRRRPAAGPEHLTPAAAAEALRELLAAAPQACRAGGRASSGAVTFGEACDGLAALRRARAQARAIDARATTATPCAPASYRASARETPLGAIDTAADRRLPRAAARRGTLLAPLDPEAARRSSTASCGAPSAAAGSPSTPRRRRAGQRQALRRVQRAHARAGRRGRPGVADERAGRRASPSPRSRGCGSGELRRAALGRRRLRQAPRPRARQLHPRRGRDRPKSGHVRSVPLIDQAIGAARSPQPARAVHGAPRPRVRRHDRQPPRRVGAAQALLRGARGGRARGDAGQVRTRSSSTTCATRSGRSRSRRSRCRTSRPTWGTPTSRRR